MKALVTGGTGLVGRALLPHLDAPIVLTRDPSTARELGDARAWDPARGVVPTDALASADVVFHLAGASVGVRWTDVNKALIRSSRVEGTRALVEAIAAASPRSRVLVCASAVGIYGDRGDETLDERSIPGDDFLASVCVEWEREARAAETHGVRVVCARLGLVLAREGGALAKMRPAFRLGAGGRLGSGRQWMSWVHLDDVVGLLLHAARGDVRGPMNVVAPAPVSNRDFTRALASALHRPALLPAPRAALRLALGEMSELLLASQRVQPRVAIESGYRFRVPTLEGALADVLA